MTRKVLRCVTPTPSGICDGRFDSLSHGGALEHVRDRHAESHACEMVQRAPWMRSTDRVSPDSSNFLATSDD
jgi:hypothetical protein